MRIKFCIFLLFIINTCLASSYHFFTPPQKWKLANPKHLSPMVEICFLGKGTTAFHPSVNIATEELDISQDEYLSIVKKMHKNDPNIEFREFGKIKTKAGAADLFELSSQSKFGTIKMLQAVLIKDNKAYVLTGSMHISEFKTMSKTILDTLKSFEIVDNLFSVIQSPKKKQLLQNAIANVCDLKSIKDKKWKKFEKIVTKEFKELGGYWQVLVIKDTYNQFLANQK